MTRHVNSEGCSYLKQWEGLRTTAYQDEAGVWTIGYGHTSAAGAPKVARGMKITEKEAEAIFKRDLAKFEARVERLVKVPLTDRQFAVIVSFDFNTGKLHSSTLLKKLNKGDYASVPGELMRWVYSDGKVSQGLVNRRGAECGLWAKGEFVSSAYVEAESQAEKTVAETTEGKATVAAGIGVVGTALTDAAAHVAPFADAVPILRWLFIGLIVAGLGVGLYATINRIKAGNA